MELDPCHASSGDRRNKLVAMDRCAYDVASVCRIRCKRMNEVVAGIRLQALEKRVFARDQHLGPTHVGNPDRAKGRVAGEAPDGSGYQTKPTRGSLLTPVEEQLHAEADSQNRPAGFHDPTECFVDPSLQQRRHPDVEGTDAWKKHSTSGFHDTWITGHERINTEP
ncbi:uncharacterized protein METZ01_LOCUS298608, partial [marine metagenome]